MMNERDEEVVKHFGKWNDQCKVDGYRLEKISTLSAPKGVRYVCELTGSAATVVLVTPYLKLYYSCKEDAILSWEGIMHKLVHLLAPLRGKPSTIGSEEERKKREYSMMMSKRALIDLTKNVSQTFLIKGKFELAIPGAMQSLIFCKDVYGQDAVEVVGSYLLLAEANLGLNRFKKAQEFLSLANWSVTKEKNPRRDLKSILHRGFGKLYAAQGKYVLASQELAKDIYNSSICFGPEHIKTSGGYFHLASVFDAQYRVESALAFYDKVVDIWYKYLSAIRINGEDDMIMVNEVEIVEALEMLKKILETRQQFLGIDHIATGEVKYTLGLLLLVAGKTKEEEKAREYVGEALKIYEFHLGSEHPSTKDVKQILLMM